MPFRISLHGLFFNANFSFCNPVPLFCSAFFCSLLAFPYIGIPPFFSFLHLLFSFRFVVKDTVCHHDNSYRNALNTSIVKVTYCLSHCIKWPEIA